MYYDKWIASSHVSYVHDVAFNEKNLCTIDRTSIRKIIIYW